MKTILLTQGQVALVDDADYEFLNQYGWCARKDSCSYYAVRNVYRPESKSQIIIRMHRIILKAPDGVQVDHRNSNGLDNRRSNLRLCNHAENGRHRRLNRRNRVNLNGVTLVERNAKNPYMAMISVNNKTIYLGYYRTAKVAARVYDLAALKHHVDFALTNEMLGLL